MEEKIIFNKERIALLNQLSKSLGEAEIKLEEVYSKKDLVGLLKIRKFMLEAGQKIEELINGQ